MPKCSQCNSIGCTNGIYVANAVLTFGIKSTGTDVDPDTGNIVDKVNELTVTAYFEGTFSTVQFVGLNQQKAFLKGRLVHPKILPDGISWDSNAKMTYIDPETKIKYAGAFFMQPLFKSERPNVAVAIAKKFGTEIAGLFQWV